MRVCVYVRRRIYAYVCVYMCAYVCVGVCMCAGGMCVCVRDDPPKFDLWICRRNDPRYKTCLKGSFLIPNNIIEINTGALMEIVQ